MKIFKPLQALGPPTLPSATEVPVPPLGIITQFLDHVPTKRESASSLVDASGAKFAQPHSYPANRKGEKAQSTTGLRNTVSGGSQEQHVGDGSIFA